MQARCQLAASCVSKLTTSLQPQVNKNKSWNEVAKALQIKDDKSAVSFLRKQYIKHLFAFECKFDHSLDFLGDHGPEPIRLNHENMRRGPEQDKQPAAKRQATSNVSDVYVF